MTRVESKKGAKTKALIFDTAVALFQKNGYEQTTMREIASECGVALGNAYYYFQSKEHIVFALYEQTLVSQRLAARETLLTEKRLVKRLQGVLNAQIAALSPYRNALMSLFKFAADPDGALSPFGPESRAIREQAQEVFKEVVAGSDEKIAADLQSELPYMFWLYHMGIVFFWMHDRSAGQAKTHRLIAVTSELVAQVVVLVGMPILKPLHGAIKRTLDELRLD